MSNYYCFYCILDPINAALVENKRLFFKSISDYRIIYIIHNPLWYALCSKIFFSNKFLLHDIASIIQIKTD